MTRFLKLSYLTAVLLSSTFIVGFAREFETTREEILASRARRSKQIEGILDENKQRLADHNSGLRILSDNDKKDLESKITVYQRKLDSMQGELDEREVERILKREKLHEERLKARRERRSEL